MTIISLQQLAKFLNKYKPKGRIADYGGTSNIGAPIVERMLSLDNVEVKEGDTGTFDINVLTQGIPKKKIPQYFVLDYDNGVDLLKPIRGKKFDNGICMDMLEHVTNPFKVAENISNSLVKGALLFVTIPWIWEIHEYPGDYWRFTPQGLITLFPKMKVISVDMVRDQVPEEELPRTRIVGVFKKKD